MAFSIRLTEQEKKIVDSYARLHSISLGEAFKQALFEKIEEEYDLAVFEKSPSLKIECVLLQLKPWNSLASVSVANAIVLATAGLV